jgi:hypothetical protein
MRFLAWTLLPAVLMGHPPQDRAPSPARRAPAVADDPCTRKIAQVVIYAVGPDHRPVGNAAIKVRRARDGKRVQGASLSAASLGEYLVIDDTEHQLVGAEPEAFEVRLQSGHAFGTGLVRIAKTGCHLRKTGGPDTIIVR